MKVVRNLCGLRRLRKPVVLAAGFFDGLHRGHEQVIRRACARAAALRGESWALTFGAHPLQMLRPERAPRLLTSTEHKLRLLAALGIHGCLLIPFTLDLAGLTPAEFAQRLAACLPTLREIAVGGNWRFGRGGRAGARRLAELGRAHGFRVRMLPAVRWQGRPISSTRVRAAVLRGDLAGAAAMLGRPFDVLGVVVRGRRVGRELGYPTANLRTSGEVLPPQGVYAVRARIRKREMDGVLNYGVCPTWGGRDAGPTLELHLLAHRGNLYGRTVEVQFVAWLRPEKPFASPAALHAQIARDIAAARVALGPPAAAAARPPVQEKNLFTLSRTAAIVRTTKKGPKRKGISRAV